MPPKIATRSSLEQIARLDVLLRRHEGASMAVMQDRLGCCEKTVRRHLAWMQRKLGCRVIRGANNLQPWRYRDSSDAIFNRDVTRWMQ
jgi:hypothetical protein